jgi:hypothetical protein
VVSTPDADHSSSVNGRSVDLLQALLSPDAAETSSSPSAANPPDPEELVKALQDLEHAASADADVREKVCC